MLPILLLISRQKQTGKTTFLNYLHLIFKDNVAMLTNDALRSKFNSDWAQKILVLIDETLLSRTEDSERLKAMSTAEYGTLESKGKDRYPIKTYHKFAGSMREWCCFARSITMAPAATRVSLFARAMVFPALTAATVDARPLKPTIDVSTMSMLSPVTRSHTDCIPANTFI